MMYTAQGRIDQSHLLESYLPTVRRIALQMMARLPANVELDDLIQAGRVGLLEASQRYRADAEASFETFAAQRIRGAMLDELRGMDWVPRGVRQSAREVEAAIRVAAQRAGRTPRETEIAGELGIGLAEYHALLVKIEGCQLLYAEDLRGEGEDEVFDRRGAEPPGDEDPLAALLSGEFRHRLGGAIAALPEREAQVLSLHYEQELSLRQIAQVLEVSQTRACQLHAQAISRLRASLMDLLGA